MKCGHNWFYGILASNERQHPWMDEGMNTYYDGRYSMLQYGTSDVQFFNASSAFIKKRLPENADAVILQTVEGLKKDQQIETPSEAFSATNYSAVAYEKTSEWMQLLEQQLGTGMFDTCMKAYYNQWKFKHPYPEDFKKVFEQTSGKNLDATFELLDKKGSLQKTQQKDIRFISFFSLRETDKHHYIAVTPAIGYNFYDKFMIGAVVHNYSLPLSKFKFVLAPLYATGSKNINGIGNAGYTWLPGNNGQKLEVSASFARFTGDSFKDSSGNENYQPFTKLVPTLRYTFANKNPRSSITRYIQFKTFLISETGLLFQRDTIDNNRCDFLPERKKICEPIEICFGKS